MAEHTIAQAYVQILPTTKGIKNNLIDALGDPAEESGKSAGSRMGQGLASGLKIATAGLAAATTAVVSFGKSSVDAGMNFDSAMSQVAATMGLTVSEMTAEVGHADTAYGEFSGNLRDFAQFLGANTAFSATEAAEALNYMALAGYDVQESMDMLPNVLSLAAAGGFDLARASDMITDAQTAFGISAERTTQMVDEMAKAASTGNTSVEQLGDAFLVVGGLAQDLNGGMITLADGTQQPVDGLQELEIALTAMANAGVKGSEAGTHMRNMLLKLASPTSDGIMQFEKLGVSVFDAEGNMRSLKDIFGDLSVALGGLTQEEKLQAISDIFNTRDVAAAEALLSAVGEDWDNIGASILDAHGAAAQMAATQLDNLAGDVTLFQSALEGAKIAISDSLTPTLREFVQYGTTAVSELGTAFKEDGLQGALEALGPIIDQGIQLIFQALPNVLEAAVALLDALVTGLITNLPKLVPAAVELIQTLVQNIVQNLPQLLDAAIEIITALADGIIEVLPELIPAIVEIIITIVDKLTDPDTLVKLIDAALQIIVAIAEGLIKALPKLIEKVPEIIKNLGQAIIQEAPQLLSAAVQLVTTLATGLIQSVGKIMEAGKQLAENAKKGWQNITEKAAEWGSELGKKISTGIKGKIGELQTAASDAAHRAKESITQKWQDAQTLGSNLLDKIRSGIGDRMSSFNDTVTKIGEGLKTYLERTGDQTPSLGRNILSALANGMSEGIPGIYDLYKRVVDSIVDSLRNVITSARSWGSDLLQNFINGLVEKWNSFVGTLRNMAQTVRDYLGFSEPKLGPLSNFHTYAPDMVDLFTKGIRDSEGELRDQIARSFDFGGQIAPPAARSEFISVPRTMAGFDGMSSNTQRQQQAVMMVDRTVFARLIYSLYNEEAQRVGVRLTGAGGVA